MSEDDPSHPLVLRERHHILVTRLSSKIDLLDRIPLSGVRACLRFTSLGLNAKSPAGSKRTSRTGRRVTRFGN
jgi:hypothetical protein